MTKNSKQSKYVRTPQAMELLGVCKTTLYALSDLHGGDIKTTSLKRRGKTRGVRLWSVASIEALLNLDTVTTNN